MFRFFRDHDPAGVEIALLARVRGVADERLCAKLIRYYFHDYDPAEAEFLLSAEEVMGMLGTGPGPDVGAALERLREAESCGNVNSRDETREFIRKNLLTKQGAMR